jgi:site-specific DNA recombinase
MDKLAKMRFRCAIYTRKSTEHNLDLEFNSLDAQREACEAYIKSQAHEGWRLIPSRYDNGAFSGASLDRPALQDLLMEVHSGKIDIIVVYKVDRLTRSLADFAKLVELFEQHSVSFVSVTQSFNTTSSMGRLTLNVLLSFAQFEREVIGELVRDKIAASKRKGMWVGGAVPMGYASANKKLVVVPEEAETVRLIFRRYLEVGSIGALVKDLDQRGIRTRRRAQSDGSVRGGIRFGVGPLNYLLRNRFVVGEVVYHGDVHRGEQEPIVDRALFDAVQAKLAASANVRELKLRASPSILIGRIYDDRGNKMTPTHTNKQGARYRYYVSHAILQKRPDEGGSVARVPAPEVETIVVEALRKQLDHSHKAASQAPASDRELIEQWVDRAVIKPQSIEIHLRSEAEQGAGDGHPESESYPESGHHPPSILAIPWTAAVSEAVKGIIHAPSPAPVVSRESRELLLTAIAKARAWIDDLAEGRVNSFGEIAKREGKVERHIRLLASLAFVSPRIVADIVDGVVPADFTVTGLAKRLAYSWAEQQDYRPFRLIT